MKQFILIIVAVLTIATATNAGWFGKDPKPDEQRIADLEHRLQQQQETTNTWRTAAFSLGVVCVVVLIIGTAIGSKGKRDAQRKT